MAEYEEQNNQHTIIMILEQNLQNTTESAIGYEPMLGEVICPNMCNNGLVKHFPDSEKALYVMVKCQFCKGRGYIHKSQKSTIEAMI